MDKPVFRAFTFKYPGRVNQLKTQVDIFYNGKAVSGVALWDTGATGSCISDQKVKDLELVPTGKITMTTPQGKTEENTYLVDIVLPNNVTVQGVVVNGSRIGEQGLDLLIGMDIISMGDFVISQPSRGTVFSFRHPSKEMTDYVKQINIENLTGKHGKGKRKRK